MSAWIAAGLFVAAALGASATRGQAPSREVEFGAVAAGPPPILAKGVGVDERLDAPLPLDLEFRDEQGEGVRLKDYFQAGRPVVLSLNYSRCPMLCNVQLTGLVDALRQIPWTPGREFEIVSVSLDPKEDWTQAKRAKEKYVRAHGNLDAAGGWHFLTGREAEIQAVARSMGVQYVYDASTDQYAHPAVFVLAAPDGRIVRYMYGKEFPPATLRLGLVEASEGRVGTTIDRVLMFCYHFDPSRGTYSLALMRLMQAGMGTAVVVLALVLIPVWIRERRRSRVRIAGAPTG